MKLLPLLALPLLLMGCQSSPPLTQTVQLPGTPASLKAPPAWKVQDQTPLSLTLVDPAKEIQFVISWQTKGPEVKSFQDFIDQSMLPLAKGAGLQPTAVHPVKVNGLSGAACESEVGKDGKQVLITALEGKQHFYLLSPVLKGPGREIVTAALETFQESK